MPVTITLEHDEALVLLEFLASGKLEKEVDVPERNALWALEGILERELSEPLSPNYSQLLGEARKSLIDRYGR